MTLKKSNKYIYIQGKQTTDVDTGNAFITCKKIKSRFTKDVFDEVEETGKSKT